MRRGLLSLPVFELEWKSSEGVYSEDHGAGNKSNGALNCKDQAAGIPSCGPGTAHLLPSCLLEYLHPLHDLDMKESVFNLLHSQKRCQVLVW